MVQISAALAATIETTRRDGAFNSVDDFTRRTGLPRQPCRGWPTPIRLVRLAWIAGPAYWRAFIAGEASRGPAAAGRLGSRRSASHSAAAERATSSAVAGRAGLSLKAHPISFCRDTLEELKIVPSARLAELPNNRSVSVAGLVLMRQQPSAGPGHHVRDVGGQTGTANLVVHPGIWERYYQAARTAAALVAYGQAATQRK